MKITHLLLAGGLLSASSLFAAAVCPTTSATTGSDPSGCSLLITFSSSGATLTTTGVGPYDGTEDVTVGVINNSKSAISSVTLSSVSSGAFGLDGDGIQNGFVSTN